MKICMVMSVFGEHAVGGAERSAHRVALGLMQRGHSVEIVSLSARGASTQVRRLQDGIVHSGIALWQLYDPYGLDGMPKVAQPAWKKLAWHVLDIYNPVMTSRLKGILSVMRPDVLVCHATQGFSIGVWRAAWELGIPLVHALHDHALVCPATAMCKAGRSCESLCSSCSALGLVRKALAPHPDAVTAPSQDILQRHLSHGWFIDTPIQRVIPNSIGPGWPVVTQAAPRRTPLRIGFLGRMDESKGIDTLIEATAQLAPRSFELHLAGGGDQCAIRQQLQRFGLLDKSSVHGPVVAADFLQSIDLLVVPSRARESFCNVVLEAACLGVPSVVSDRGALPERVEHGRTGWIVSAGDSTQLAQVLQTLIDCPQEIQRKAQLALAQRERHPLELEVRGWEQLCEQVRRGAVSRTPAAS